MRHLLLEEKKKTGTCSESNCTNKVFYHTLCRTHSYLDKRSSGVTGIRAVYVSEYAAWFGIKNRCYNPKYPFFHRYGGRGIRVCDRWLDVEKGFENFLEDLGEKPSSNHTIDRINNDKNYSPDNCRWAMPIAQALNRGIGSNNTSGVKGVCWHVNNQKWLVRVSVDKKEKYIGQFVNLSDAIAAREAAVEKYYKPILGGQV